MSKGIILYLRTDISDQDITAGGSVAHTLGVIKGFHDLGYSIVCASSCLSSEVLGQVSLEDLIRLKNPTCLRFLRWKLNCFLSSFFFFFQARTFLKKYPITFIYQRYSLLNCTGVLLSWWYKKKLILEYNGSEAWTVLNWIERKPLVSGKWFLYAVEKYNVMYADSIVVVSEVLKDELLKRGVPDYKILINPNGVDPNYFDSERIKKECIQ